QFGNRCDRQRLKADDLATRANRGKLLGRACADQDEDRSWRRLFERLKQAVRPFLIHVIGVVNDSDFSPAEKRLYAQFMAKPDLLSLSGGPDERFHRNVAFALR